MNVHMSEQARLTVLTEVHKHSNYLFVCFCQQMSSDVLCLKTKQQPQYQTGGQTERQRADSFRMIIFVASCVLHHTQSKILWSSRCQELRHLASLVCYVVSVFVGMLGCLRALLLGRIYLCVSVQCTVLTSKAWKCCTNLLIIVKVSHTHTNPHTHVFLFSRSQVIESF